MDYGINVPTTGPLSETRGLIDLAVCAEQLGCHSIWIGDHIAVPVRFDSRYPYSTSGKVGWEADLPWPSPFSTLAWVGAHTSRMVLGTSVLILPMRSPLATAHAAATLDWLSEGRLCLGVGVGWMREEFELLGAPFEARGARMDESIEIMRRCWRADPAEFHGTHFDLSSFAMNPKPHDATGIPIVCGGQTDSALRRVARLADGWQPYRVTPDLLAERMERLHNLLAEAGREMDQLVISVRVNESDPLDAGMIRDYEALGVELLIKDLDYTDLDIDGARAELEWRAESILKR